MNTNEVLNKLKVEIERRIAQWQPYTFACASQIASEAFDRIDELKGLLIYITSLQQEQPEVDLEKLLDGYYKNADFGPSEAIEYEIHKDIARHFYELGRLSNK